MRTTMLVSAICACLTLGAQAQGKPDFSGRWTSDLDPAAVAAAAADQPAGAAGQRGRGAGPAGGRGGRGDMGSGWGSTIAIAQDAARLTVEYVFFSRGDMQPPMRFVYALDGSETNNTVMMGNGMQAQASRTSWDGDKLVITTRTPSRIPKRKSPRRRKCATCSRSNRRRRWSLK